MDRILQLKSILFAFPFRFRIMLRRPLNEIEFTVVEEEQIRKTVLALLACEKDKHGKEKEVSSNGPSKVHVSKTDPRSEEEPMDLDG